MAAELTTVATIWFLPLTRSNSHPLNLQPETRFEGYHVKFTQVFIECHLRFFRVATKVIVEGCAS